MKEEIREEFAHIGAVAVGFAKSEPLPEDVMRSYDEWIKGGNLAGMGYLTRHALLKRSPSSVLENAQTVISMAFSYAPAEMRDDMLPRIACYAYGLDYHDVLRKRLAPVVDVLKTRFGGDWRICIDSAPLAERYWAVRSGIGVRGMNGCVIVSGSGSHVFLVEVLTSIAIEPDKPLEGDCGNCGACVRACPQKALKYDGTIDCRRCINYLTIEHRGEWDGDASEAMDTHAARNSLFGCDICLNVCPHNRDLSPTVISEFRPIPGLLTLTADAVKAMGRDDFTRFFKGSPIKRAGYEGMMRNARNVH